MPAKSPLEIFLISCKTRPKPSTYRLPELIVAVVESLLLSNLHWHSPGPGDNGQAHPYRLTNSQPPSSQHSYERLDESKRHNRGRIARMSSNGSDPRQPKTVADADTIPDQ